jgi:uncharacterized GH25 family protein
MIPKPEAAMRRTFALLLLLFSATTSVAHYNMLIPDKAWANKGDKVTFTYQFGHPFEHELFDAPKPVGLLVNTPSGKMEILDVDKILTEIKVDGANGKKVTAWQFTFTPPERGDYTISLKTAKIKHEDDNYFEDVAKVVLHVQTQKGWDRQMATFENELLDIWPYTRPYGLLPGMTFKGRILNLRGLPNREDEIFGRLSIEVEKYNERAPKKLPPDELITFKTKADPLGFFVATLPESGWWGITVSTRPPENLKEKSSAKRTTFWFHVDEKK